MRKGLSMSIQVILVYVALLTAIIIISSTIYLRETNRIEQTSENTYMNRELLAYQAVFEDYIDQIDENSLLICNSDNIQSVLKKANLFTNTIPNLQLDTALIRQLTGIKAISSVVVFDIKGTMYKVSDAYKRTQSYKDIWSAPWYEEVFALDGGYILRIDSGGFFDETEESKGYISLIRSIKDTSNHKLIGTLIVNISMQPLIKKYRDLADEMGLCVVICNEFNHAAFATSDVEGIPLEECLRAFTWENKNYQIYRVKNDSYKVCCRQLEESGWRIAGIMKRGNYRSEKIEFRNISIRILLINLALIFVVLWIYNTLLAKSLKPVLESMKFISSEQFLMVRPVNMNREILELQNGYNKMVLQIQNLLHTIRQEQDMKKKIDRSRLGLGSALLQPSAMIPRRGFFRSCSRISRSLEMELPDVKTWPVKPCLESVFWISWITPG